MMCWSRLTPSVAEFSCPNGETCSHICIAKGKDRTILIDTLSSNKFKVTVLISTHLIEDIEPVLDEAIFLKEGTIFAHRSVDEIRENEGMSVDAYFREVFKC